jgi:hypothetical protein
MHLAQCCVFPPPVGSHLFIAIFKRIESKQPFDSMFVLNNHQVTCSTFHRKHLPRDNQNNNQFIRQNTEVLFPLFHVVQQAAGASFALGKDKKVLKGRNRW